MPSRTIEVLWNGWLSRLCLGCFWTGVSPITSSCAGLSLVSLCDGEEIDLIMSLTTVNGLRASIFELH